MGADAGTRFFADAGSRASIWTIPICDPLLEDHPLASQLERWRSRGGALRDRSRLAEHAIAEQRAERHRRRREARELARIEREQRAGEVARRRRTARETAQLERELKRRAELERSRLEREFLRAEELRRQAAALARERSERKSQRDQGAAAEAERRLQRRLELERRRAQALYRDARLEAICLMLRALEAPAPRTRRSGSTRRHAAVTRVLELVAADFSPSGREAFDAASATLRAMVAPMKTLSGSQASRGQASKSEVPG